MSEPCEGHSEVGHRPLCADCARANAAAIIARLTRERDEYLGAYTRHERMATALAERLIRAEAERDRALVAHARASDSERETLAAYGRELAARKAAEAERRRLRKAIALIRDSGYIREWWWEEHVAPLIEAEGKEGPLVPCDMAEFAPDDDGKEG